MNKFRYSVDLGAGFVSVDVYDLDLELVKKRSEESSAIVTSKLDGSLSFIGTMAESIYAKRLSSYYVPFKAEEFNGTTWNLLHTCYVDIRGDYFYSQKKLVVNEFIEQSGIVDKILSAYNISFDITHLISSNEVFKSITSTALDIVVASTTIGDPWIYPNYYSVEQVLYTTYDGTQQDPRWDYFELFSTTEYSPGLFTHTYKSRSFNYCPGIGDGYNGYYKIIYKTINYWVKKPPFNAGVYTNETFNAKLATVLYRLDDILDTIIGGIDSSYSFDYLDPGQSSNYYHNSFFGNTSEFNNEAVGKMVYVLGDILEFMKVYLGLQWYISGTKLKFHNLHYKYFTSTYDWSALSIDLRKFQMAYTPMPDMEIFNFKDTTFSPHIISYFAKGVKTEGNIIDRTSFFYHDFFELKKGIAPNDNIVFVDYISSNINVDSPKDFWDDWGSNSCYSEYSPYYVKLDPTLNYGTIPPDLFLTRPIYKIEFNQWLNDYSAFNLLSKIKIDASNTGYCNEMRINMKTGDCIFSVFFDTLTI